MNMMMTAIMIILNEQEIVTERKKVKKGALEYLLHPTPFVLLRVNYDKC